MLELSNAGMEIVALVKMQIISCLCFWYRGIRAVSIIYLKVYVPNHMAIRNPDPLALCPIRSVGLVSYKAISSQREIDFPPPVNQTLCIRMHIPKVSALVSKIATG